MNAKDLLTWAENEKTRLEGLGRTQGGQYKACMKWIDDAKKLLTVPADYAWPEIDESNIADPRDWATRMMYADNERLKNFVRFGGEL